MAEKSLDYQFVRHRLREALGEPRPVLDRDDAWSLRPPALAAISIDVITDRGATAPVIWVFDPYLPEDGMVRLTIHDESDLEDAIRLIHDRLEHATHRHDDPLPPEAERNRQFLEKLLADCRRTDWSERSYLIIGIEKALTATRGRGEARGGAGGAGDAGGAEG